jgi:hypothetical protein
MSGQSQQTLASDWILPPRSSAAGAACDPAQVLASPVTFAISSTVVAVDLSNLCALTKDARKWPNGQVGQYVTITPDGCDCYIITGPTFASVTGANAPVAQTVQTIGAAGQSVATAGSCQLIPKGTIFPMMLQQKVDLFVAVVTLGAATGFCTVAQSSP